MNSPTTMITTGHMPPNSGIRITLPGDRREPIRPKIATPHSAQTELFRG